MMTLSSRIAHRQIVILVLAEPQIKQRLPARGISP
jgi:hypothetical protein